MRVLVFSLVTVLFVSMSFIQTASTHNCHDSETTVPALLQTDVGSGCEHESKDHASCCADMTMRHCSSGSLLFVGQPSFMGTASTSTPLRVDAPIDTSIRVKHSSTLFRPPITIAA